MASEVPSSYGMHKFSARLVMILIGLFCILDFSTLWSWPIVIVISSWLFWGFDCVSRVLVPNVYFSAFFFLFEQCNSLWVNGNDCLDGNDYLDEYTACFIMYELFYTLPRDF